MKPIITKRKRSTDDEQQLSNKRKIRMNKTDSDDDEHLTLSPRISPVHTKISRSSHRILSTLFRCQLCRCYLKNKDNYLDHMILCAIRQQASIKIVRSIPMKT